MPLRSAATQRHRGWWNDQINNRIVATYNGTEIFDWDGNDIVITPAVAHAAAVSNSSSFTSSIVGNAFIAPTGNVALGNPGVFSDTQPQGAVVMGGAALGGVAPAGTITTACAIFASNTAVRKIIADSTVSNIET